jgi:signal transduction histidine kinase
VGALGAWLMAVQFTRPLRRLEASFKQVERGDLDGATVPVGRADEIGALSASFNRMVERLSETRTIEQRLVENERLAAVGRLAAGVAHEVRNPLNAIQLTMQQLRDRTAPGPDSPEREDFDRYYSSVTGELHRLDRLVTTFLDLSHAGALPLERLDLVGTVRAAALLFAPDAEQRGVQLEMAEHGPIWVKGDPSKLATVWNNLLSNALRACAPGDRVQVGFDQDETGPGTVTVTITDTGSGMSHPTLERIWDPFYSERSDGTGLGLSIVKTVVERHAGSVSASSVPGRGTVMAVTLPRDAEEGRA